MLQQPVSITLWIERATVDAIDQLAKAAGKSRTELVRSALSRLAGVRRNKKAAPPKTSRS